MGTGILNEAATGSLKTGFVNGAGGVKVGKRVEVGTTLNCAASVRSIVGVAGGTGVGGGSMIRSAPDDKVTSGE